MFSRLKEMFLSDKLCVRSLVYSYLIDLFVCTLKVQLLWKMWYVHIRLKCKSSSNSSVFLGRWHQLLAVIQTAAGNTWWDMSKYLGGAHSSRSCVIEKLANKMLVASASLCHTVSMNLTVGQEENKKFGLVKRQHVTHSIVDSQTVSVYDSNKWSLHLCHCSNSSWSMWGHSFIILTGYDVSVGHYLVLSSWLSAILSP